MTLDKHQKRDREDHKDRTAHVSNNISACSSGVTRELLHEYLALLCREDRFRDTLLDPQHQYAFDCLLEDTWWPNEDVILSLELPIMDTVNLITGIHNQRRLAALRQKLDDLISRLSPMLRARYRQRLWTLEY